MVNKSRSQVVPTILTLALVACEGSIMGVADPEVEFEAVPSIAAMLEQPPESLVGGNDVVGLVGGNDVVDREFHDQSIENFSVLDTNNPFNAAGEVTTWEVWVSETRQVRLVIYRKTGNVFEVVGTSGTETPVLGFNQFTTSIQVLAGDFVGLVNNRVVYDSSEGDVCLGNLNGTMLFAFEALATVFINSCNRFYSVRATGTVTPSNEPPVADHGGPYMGLEGGPVAFDGSDSDDPGGDPLMFDWDFGDPLDTTPGSEEATSHTYADDGVFAVTLTVTDDPAGAPDEVTTTATITNVSPAVGTITGPLEPVLVGTEVTVGADFTDPGTLDTHYGTIDWGDGPASAATITETGGSGSVSGKHTYTTPGVYAVQVSVTDDDGGTGASSIFDLVVAVEIDIKPGSDPNCFNSNGHGVLPVAILGTVDFDVAAIDAATVKLEDLSVEERGRRRKKLMAHFDDVSGPNGIPDGFIDLVLQFKDDGTFTSGSSTANLTAYLDDGTQIVGSDDICLVPLDERRRFRSKRRQGRGRREGRRREGRR